MRVDGREIPVTGSLLPPLHRRTSDIMRVAIAAVLLGGVIAGSLITRSQWDALETSVSNIVGVLSPSLSDTVYLLYGIAILALPFAILIGLIVGRRWKLLAGYAAAGLCAGVALSFTGTGLAAPKWHLDVPDRLDATFLSIVPARSMLGLAVGYLIGAVIVLAVGTPALEVPLDSAVRVLARRGYRVTAFRVVSPSGIGPLVMSAAIDQAPDDEPFDELVVELYGQNQRSSGAIRQTFRWISFRNRETPPPYGSLRRAVEHRALMGIAFADIGLASSKAVAISVLDRGWEMYARPSPRGIPLAVAVENQAGEEESTKLIDALWQTLHTAHVHQM
eukprot:gene24383-29249_t